MKKIPIKKRNEVILIAKKIISFYKSNGNLNRSLFNNTSLLFLLNPFNRFIDDLLSLYL